MTLTEEDLKELGITAFGARKKMLLTIQGGSYAILTVFLKRCRIYFTILYAGSNGRKKERGALGRHVKGEGNPSRLACLPRASSSSLRPFIPSACYAGYN